MAADPESEPVEKSPSGLTRRKFLIGGAAGAGLVVAWAVWPRSYEPNVAATENEQVFGAFLKISEDGQVIVVVPQSEMGQGVYTVLPQILADELGADWRTVAVEPAPINPLYSNSLLAGQWAESLMPSGIGKLANNDALQWISQNVTLRDQFMVTADSTSIPGFAASFREAGAAARVLLTKAAAARWDVAWETCTVENGVISSGDKKLRFGELVREAAQESLPDPVPLRPDRMCRVSICRANSMVLQILPGTSGCPTWSLPRSGKDRSAKPG